MVSLTKEEILKSLGRVSMSIESIINNPDKPMIELICQNYTIDEIESKKIKFDYQIYSLIVDLRIISFLEDSFLDLIKEDELDLGSIKEEIFINSSDSKRFSNKQIVKYIRNAVSHSDLEKELFKISPNGRFVEINLKNTKPIPFHVKINYENLVKIISILTTNCKNRYCSYVDIDNMVIKRIYYKEQLDPKIIYKDYDINNRYNYDETYNYLIKYLDVNNIQYEVKSYNLKIQQEDLIKKFKKLSKEFGEEKYAFLFTVLNSIIPLPQEKIHFLMNHSVIVNLIYKYYSYTYEKLHTEITNGLKSEKFNNSEISNYIYNRTNQASLMDISEMYYASSDYYLRNETIIQFITYYISCYCKENDLKINRKTISKENLRNALVHGRWFDDMNKNLVYFDTENGKNNDYNFYMDNVLTLQGLFKYCLEDMKKNRTKKY